MGAQLAANSVGGEEGGGGSVAGGGVPWRPTGDRGELPDPLRPVTRSPLGLCRWTSGAPARAVGVCVCVPCPSSPTSGFPDLALLPSSAPSAPRSPGTQSVASLSPACWGSKALSLSLGHLDSVRPTAAPQKGQSPLTPCPEGQSPPPHSTPGVFWASDQLCGCQDLSAGHEPSASPIPGAL